MKIIKKIYHLLQKPFIEKLCFNKKNVESLKQLKNSHFGEKCFIVGNGPSLQIKDLERIKSFYSFAANRIYKIFDETSWRPNCFCCQDPTILRNNYREFSNINILKIISPIGFRKYNVKNAIYFFKDNKDYLLRKSPKFSEDISKCIYDGFTITYTMIQIAVYMGFETIILIGNDFNYDVDSGNILGSSYMSSKMIQNGVNTALPDYEYWKLAFYQARIYAEKNNIKIINATRGGKLDIFERKNLDCLIKEMNC